jgi:hypothetical protein
MRTSAIFAGDVPARITVVDFRRYHLQSFPSLSEPQYDELIQDAIDQVYAMFSGIGNLWDMQPRQIWYDKTILCYRLLTAWYIADMYPMFLAGLPVMGGIPLKRKRIGMVDITFADFMHGNANDILESLKSNPFGGKAYLMIRAAGKRMMLRNRRTV